MHSILYFINIYKDLVMDGSALNWTGMILVEFNAELSFFG